MIGSHGGLDDMTLLNRLFRSESPKFEHPIKTTVGRVMQKSGRFEHLRVQRGYELPFFSASNFSLTYWVAPGLVDPTEEFVRTVLRPGMCSWTSGPTWAP